MSQAKTTKDFNKTAEKLVSMEELKERIENLYASKLDTIEYVTVTQVVAPAAQKRLQDMIVEAGLDENSKSAKVLAGVFKTSAGSVYVSEKAYKAMNGKSVMKDIHPDLGKKIARLRNQAFKSCKDHAEDKNLQKKLKPLLPL